MNAGAAERTEVTANFFTPEVPSLQVLPPSQRLFEVLDKIANQKLFPAEYFYAPGGYRLNGGVYLSGLRVPLSSPWLNKQISEGRISRDVDLLPKGYFILDVSKGLSSDSEGLGEILTELRRQGKIQVPDHCKKVRSDSRTALSADEIDGKDSFVVEAVASVLGLRPEEKLTTPSCAVLNYYGNLVNHPALGKVTTPEWLADSFVRGGRLIGSGFCGDLDGVNRFAASSRHHRVSFNLMIQFPVE